jgi:EAL domain-containing protein (putative c-di-GMP-specific phosphodiesterase class I)
MPNPHGHVHLKRFPINTLKVDQFFVRDRTDGADNAAIVSAIVSMARSLKMKVIAEGVETREQLDFLASVHCDGVQGFYFNRALPPDQIAEMLRSSTKKDTTER